MKLVFSQIVSICFLLNVFVVSANEPTMIYQLKKSEYRLEIESISGIAISAKGSANGPNMIQYLGDAEHVFGEFFPGISVESNSEWSKQVIRMTVYTDGKEITPALKNKILSDLAENGQGIIEVEESMKDVYCLSVNDTKLYDKAIFRNSKGTVTSMASGPDYLELKGYSLTEIADKLSEKSDTKYFYEGDAEDKLKVNLDTQNSQSIIDSFAKAGVLSTVCQKDFKKVIL